MTNNTIIGLKNLRENMEKYISQIKKGKSFVVVKKSKPIFKLTPLDIWGDEGLWETVVDFNKIQKGGVPATDVIASLKRLNA
jgi:antitoxin (DNA-binding transcriptional repressor) of toxin-antitoxin stability system